MLNDSTFGTPSYGGLPAKMAVHLPKWQSPAKMAVTCQNGSQPAKMAVWVIENVLTCQNGSLSALTCQNGSRTPFG